MPKRPSAKKRPLRSSSRRKAAAATRKWSAALKQGKNQLDAWWIIVPPFALLVLTKLLLTFIGDAVRDAFDTRKS